MAKEGELFYLRNMCAYEGQVVYFAFLREIESLSSSALRVPLVLLGQLGQWLGIRTCVYNAAQLL